MEITERTLGVRIWELREQRGWSQKKLAEEAGISHVTIVGLETGKRDRVRMPTARRLARAFGISVEELLGEGLRGKLRDMLAYYERQFDTLEREVERAESGETPLDGIGGLSRRISAEAIAAESALAAHRPDEAARILNEAAELIDRLTEVTRRQEQEMEAESERLRDRLPAA